MANIEIHLSDELVQFVDGQVRAGNFSDAGSYVMSLIARAHRGTERLESLLVAGLESGEPCPLDDEAWHQLRADVHERLSDGE